MAATAYQQIRASLLRLYLDAPRSWLVGFSGGKAETSRVRETPRSQGGKPIAVLRTDRGITNDE